MTSEYSSRKYERINFLKVTLIAKDITDTYLENHRHLSKEHDINVSEILVKGNQKFLIQEITWEAV